MSGQRPKPNVVITGFGPFRDVKVNPSWEAIKDPIVIDRPVNVIIEEIPVRYDIVDWIVPKLWRDYNPILMIHIGVAAHESSIRIECCARHGPYIGSDADGVQAPHRHEFDECVKMRKKNQEFNRNYENNIIDVSDEKQSNDTNDLTTIMTNALQELKNDRYNRCLVSSIDLSDAIQAINNSTDTKLNARASKDAGLYLCEYIYMKSLALGERTVFIHVPSTVDFSLDDIKTALKLSIECLVDQVLTKLNEPCRPSQVHDYCNWCEEFKKIYNPDKKAARATVV